MIGPDRMATRRRLVVALAVLAVMAGVWAIGIAVIGPVEWSLGGVRLRSRNPVRPIVLAAAFALAAALLDGTAARASALHAWSRFLAVRLPRLPAVSPASMAAVLAVAVAVAGSWWGPRTVGAADSYGYVSEARAWRDGLPRIDLPMARELPWSNATGTLAPLGWTASGEPGVAVPVYAPGFPLTLAAASAIGGEGAIFAVVPVLAGLAVWLAFCLGRLLAGDAVGLATAALLAASPALLFLLLASGPMSDIPALAWWLGAVVGAATPARGRIALVASGLSTALAVLTRPNLVVLAPLVGALAAWPAPTARQAVGRMSLWTISMLPGPLVTAAINSALYGSPLQSGYGDLSVFYALNNVVPNASRYGAWLMSTQTPLIVAGLAAPLVLWRAGSRRAAVAALWCLAFSAAVVGPYLFYLVFDEWWWALRFVLPAYPMLLATAAAAVATALRPFGRWRQAVLIPLVAGVCWHGVTYLPVSTLRAWGDDWLRYREASDYARQLPPGAVVVAQLHSGPLRYYAGVPALRWDLLDADWLDRAVAHLAAAGHPVYAVLEPVEMDLIKARFRATSSLSWAETPVSVTAHGTQIYRLSAPAP